MIYKISNNRSKPLNNKTQKNKNKSNYLKNPISNKNQKYLNKFQYYNNK